MRVIIIGAGLGGLTLAHGLRAAGHDVVVHERSPVTGPPPASYGIHVNAHGNRALHACLPAENWARYDRGSTPAPDVVRFRDPSLAPLIHLGPGSPAEAADPVTHRRAVRRDALHRALLHGLDGPDGVVRWDSTFAAYTVKPDRRVRVELADGTDDEGDLLVGADGSNSRVRGRYRPELARRELGVVTVAGRVPLGHPAVRALPPDMIDGSVNNVVPRGPGWLFVSTWPAPPGDATTEGVLVWAWAAERSALPVDVDTRPGDELGRWVSGRVDGWDPRVAALITAGDPAGVAPVTLRSMARLPAWTPSPVTLLGDAAHTMSPMAGIGATTALRDADTLRRALAGATASDLPRAVGAYEHEMRTYANEAITLSTRNARHAGASGRVPRLAFRTLLTVADAVPPVRRSVFPATARTGGAA